MGMKRKILLSFPEEGVKALAMFYEEEAPITCNVIWKTLPIKGYAIHDIWSGQIVFTFLDPMKVIPPECVPRSGAILPGELFYWYAPKNYLHGKPYGRNGYSEIGIAYGRDCQPMCTRGVKNVNVFARITEGLDSLAEVCNRMIYEGQKKIIIERVS
jgi:hypothetical protein